jgi:hypothetical protein
VDASGRVLVSVPIDTAGRGAASPMRRVGVDLYEAAYVIPAGTTAVPVVTASASDPAVQVEIAQAESTTGTAVVTFNYRGVVETYKVVLGHGE